MPPGASLGVKARAVNQLRIELRRRKWVAPTKGFDFFLILKLLFSKYETSSSFATSFLNLKSF